MILHVDMDAFYASVEERERPELKGRPVIVGGSPSGRGVVCAANYAARKYGISSAQPAARAYKLCPHAVFLKPRFELYASVSKQIREIFSRYTPLIEPLSFDEAFLDVSGSERLLGDSEAIGHAIQASIREELSLPCSVGVAPSKFAAKIASDLQKPNGFVAVRREDVQSFLDPLPVRRIWGVGAKGERRLLDQGISTIRDLRSQSPDTLLALFGRLGPKLWNLANGNDARRVVPDHIAKRIGHETTFEEDISDREVLRAWLNDLAANVARRLRRQHRTAKTIVLKVRYDDFTTISRSYSLAEPTDSTGDIFRAADDLLRNRLPIRPVSVRLLGVSVTGLSSTTTQKLLFADVENSTHSIDAVADAISHRFGRGAIQSGLSLTLRQRNPRSTPEA